MNTDQNNAVDVCMLFSVGADDDDDMMMMKYMTFNLFLNYYGNAKRETE